MNLQRDRDWSQEMPDILSVLYNKIIYLMLIVGYFLIRVNIAFSRLSLRFD